MNLKSTVIAIALMTIAAWGGACASAPIAQPPPHQQQVSVTATEEATTFPSSPTANGEEAARPTVEPTATPTEELTATPTMAPTALSTPEASALEEDCMAECHPPDPNEYFDAGAKPLPANHAGRTTCLECHATATFPVLPATHLGRLDAACRGCHK